MCDLQQAHPTAKTHAASLSAVLVSILFKQTKAFSVSLGLQAPRHLLLDLLLTVLDPRRVPNHTEHADDGREYTPAQTIHQTSPLALAHTHPVMAKIPLGCQPCTCG